MQNPNQTRFTRTNIRFFDVFCVAVMSKFMQSRKVQLSFTGLQTDRKLIIIYQNNELNLTYDKDYIVVTWWSGYYRYNGERHPDYPLTQHKRSYYKLHDKTGKVFTVGLADQVFVGQQLEQIEEAADSIVNRFCGQQHTMPISLGKKQG